eukprot:6225734-Amphidinium_carterae.2
MQATGLRIIWNVDAARNVCRSGLQAAGSFVLTFCFSWERKLPTRSIRGARQLRKTVTTEVMDKCNLKLHL